MVIILGIKKRLKKDKSCRYKAQRVPMKVRDFCCPNCKSKNLMFSGTQKGYGYTPDMDLWTCRRCHSTISVTTEGKPLHYKR